MSRFDDWLTTEPDPGPEVEVWRNRKARKEWECAECARPILPGTDYQECRQLLDGAWIVIRLCAGPCLWGGAEEEEEAEAL